jgi:hypothetical protein
MKTPVRKLMRVFIKNGEGKVVHQFSETEDARDAIITSRADSMMYEGYKVERRRICWTCRNEFKGPVLYAPLEKRWRVEFCSENCLVDFAAKEMQ